MIGVIFLFIVVVVFALVYVSFKDEGRDISQSKNNKVENLLSDEMARMFMSRRDYYRNVYLKSDAWKRKRYVVLKRDNWCCVYCGKPATQVHHKKYAKRNIGKEPIEWLVSVCKSCHDQKHVW